MGALSPERKGLGLGPEGVDCRPLSEGLLELCLLCPWPQPNQVGPMASIFQMRKLLTPGALLVSRLQLPSSGRAHPEEYPRWVTTDKLGKGRQ